ncbi:hypothetical protein HYPSUDRAFT_654477 [Hypholoma sublateritium FD-334 SS-4]|uniref:Uncharacterized protein n=1 Tax=Hypholoma sublateritium (strain FD-334 SS-4) TaxID=945553 RepID=A0A0D2L6J0_HYPSF|nr:hypothetical protein HYPSUDRAFT_654477 [Hypholoma sublateritium FD-334 SS-4]
MHDHHKLLTGFTLRSTVEPLTVVRLVVSTDGEQYRVVDVSGAPDGTWIRRHILLKLSIPERIHARFSIYPSEVGSYALGGALNDRRLFSHCRESGDPSGSLKLFVSTSPDLPVSSDISFASQGFQLIGTPNGDQKLQRSCT